MKNIKKFGKGWAVFILIGVGVGIFVAHVVGPAFDLDKFAIIAIAVVSGIILASLYWIFVKSRKKKDEKK